MDVRSKHKVTQVCQECKTVFNTEYEFQRFCSRKCGSRFYYRERYRHDPEFKARIKKYIHESSYRLRKKYPEKTWVNGTFSNHKNRNMEIQAKKR